jgi:cytochrome P450
MTLKSIPRLPGLPIIGNLLDFKNDRLALYQHLYEQMGDIGEYRLFSKSFVLLSNAEYTRQFLIEHHQDFERSPVMLMMKPILGEGLLTTNNRANTQQRQWIHPVFQLDRFPDYAQSIVQQTNSFQKRWSASQELNLSQTLQELTLSIIGKTLFGVDTVQELPEFAQFVTDLLYATDQRLKFFLPLPLSCPLPINRKLSASIKPLNALLNRLIEERRTSPQEGKKDLLFFLLNAKDEATNQPLTNQQICDQMMTFLFAGHETTANTLAWTFYLLARHPSIYDRLQEELDSTLQGKAASYDDLKRLPYTLQVIKETLRLYPVAYAFGRTALKPLALGDYKVPKGRVVLASPYILHRRPDYFTEPEQFNPDRFLPEAEAALPRSAYIPFGSGPRACIGRQFALMEAQLIVATLAQKYRFRLLNDQVILPDPMITLRPSSNIRIRLEPVHSKALV